MPLTGCVYATSNGSSLVSCDHDDDDDNDHHDDYDDYHDDFAGV